MQWDNLLTAQCPECRGPLKDAGVGYKCKKCGYTILYEDFRKAVSK